MSVREVDFTLSIEVHFIYIYIYIYTHTHAYTGGVKKIFMVDSIHTCAYRIYESSEYRNTRQASRYNNNNNNNNTCNMEPGKNFPLLTDMTDMIPIQ